MRALIAIPICFLLTMPAPGWADKSTDTAFDALRAKGLKKQHDKDFDGALKAYVSATQLKNAPSVWLNVVSVHADRAKRANNPTAYCAETKAALKKFFTACANCKESKTRMCSPCRMVDAKLAKKTMALRTARFAKTLETRGKALRASVSALSDNEKARLKYRSTGLIAKSSELNRCLHAVKFASKPSGAIATQDSGTIGRAPVEAPLFMGEETVRFNKPEFAQTSRIIQVTPKLMDPVVVELVSATATAGSTTITTEGSSGKRLAGWISISLGGISLATSGTFMSIAIAKRDDAKSINGQFGRQDDFEKLKDESRSALTITGITAGVGLVAVGAGVWLLLDGAPKKKEVTALHLTPTGFAVTGRF